MVHIISITNQKGGVGKTTTALSLASGLSCKGAKTLLIDSDSQANATSGLNVSSKNTFYDFLSSSIPLQKCIQKVGNIQNLDIIPADQRLSGVEIEWAGVSNNKFILKERLQYISKNYDYIFIDCPPSLGLLTVNALSASDYFIVPLQCEYYALEGLSLLLNTACAIKENLNSELLLLGILLTMFDSRNTLSKKVCDQVRKHFSEKVFQSLIPRNVRLSEAPSHGLSIFDYDKSSKGAKAYEKLCEEFLKKIPFKGKELESVL